eukprot:CAMPEP_0182536088 /NCGR_PEP_ID=MMETSP1323-20130603/19288_1 /TAXON_ID=236787 /ORGANISM="Florenciella parvula, Strain RCC1693" /LENGTH=157 /DNA_ID=CAMNT_0024746287 /DNA_START=245 /DNA_END=714 /DNA_ORIENTATION=+
MASEVTEATKRKSVTFNSEELGPTGSGSIGSGTEEAAHTSGGGGGGNGYGGGTDGNNVPANRKIDRGNLRVNPNDIGIMADFPPPTPPTTTRAATAPMKPSALSATPPPAPSASLTAETMAFDFKPERADRGATSDLVKEGVKASGGGDGGGGGGGG